MLNKRDTNTEPCGTPFVTTVHSLVLNASLNLCRPLQGYDLTHLRPRQDDRHFADDIFKCIFLNENVWFLNKISLMFVPKSLINNIPALVQIMAWRRLGDKPLSEPMMFSLPTHRLYVSLGINELMSLQDSYETPYARNLQRSSLRGKQSNALLGSSRMRPIFWFSCMLTILNRFC